MTARCTEFEFERLPCNGIWEGKLGGRESRRNRTNSWCGVQLRTFLGDFMMDEKEEDHEDGR